MRVAPALLGKEHWDREMDGQMEVKSNLTATPTEYRGIRFRSKCEAMFARNLDVWRSKFCRKNLHYMEWFESVWVYEPKLEWLNGFSCDFLLTRIELRNEEPFIIHEMVEYKPSKPTRTFCNNYFRRFFKHRNSTGIRPNVAMDAEIFYGSVYNKDRGIVVCQNEEDYPEFVEWDWIVDESKLLNYRYDLDGKSA